ncbi:hypothetical protein SCALM49S_03598 [Streptomyces californicus]
MLGVDVLALLEVEAGGVGVDVLDVERGDQLVHREDVPVLGDRPAQQREVVEQPLGEEAALAVEVEGCLRVALGELLVALAHDVREVAEGRGVLGDAQLDERPVQGDLARGGGEQVLAAQDVGDLHQRVVDRVDQRVERGPVGADDAVVGDVLRLDGDLAADQVGEGDGLVGHPEADDRGAALGLVRGLPLGGEVAAVAVVAGRLPGGAGGVAAGVQLLGGAVAGVGVPGGEELLGDVLVQVHPLRLAVGGVRAADLGALVPVQAEPAHRVEQLLVGLLRVARRVGVLDPEDQGALVVPGEGPVEQRRPDQAHVGVAGRERDRNGRVAGALATLDHLVGESADAFDGDGDLVADVQGPDPCGCR